MAKLPERDLKTFWNRLKDVYEYFKSRGISDEITAALMGNIARESSGFWNKEKKLKNNKTGKIDIYRGGVMNELLTYDWILNYYKGYDKKHLLTYLADGILGVLPEVKSERGSLLEKRFSLFRDIAKRTKNVSELAKAWEEIYEISGHSLLDERQLCAEYFYKLILKEKSKIKSSSNRYESKSLPSWANPDFSKPVDQTQNPYYNFTSDNSDTEYPTYNLDDIKTEFDLPLYASNYKNGGKLIKKHLYGGTMASRYLLTFYDPNNPLLTYVNLADAQKAGLLFTNNIDDPYSGAYFSYEIGNNSQPGEDEKGRMFKNNIAGQLIIPENTYVAIDPYRRIINNKDFNVILNGLNLLSTNGATYDLNKGWITFPKIDLGQIIDQNLLDLAELAARFLSDRGFEHAWKMGPKERIKFARDVLISDAAGYATVFGSQIPKAATSAYNWMTGTNAGRAFTSSMLAGEAIDTGSRAITGQSFGDYFANMYGGSPFLWGMGNPGYWFGGNLVKPITNTVEPIVSKTSKELTKLLVNSVQNSLKNKTVTSFTENEFNITPEALNNSLYKDNITLYTKELREYVKNRLEELGLDTSIRGIPVEFIGDIDLQNKPMFMALKDLLKYRLHKFYAPVGSNLRSSNFEIPTIDFTMKTLNGDIYPVRLKDANNFFDWTIKQPFYLTIAKGFGEGAARRSYVTLDDNTIRAFSSGIAEKEFINIEELIDNAIHELVGHSTNFIAPKFKSSKLGTGSLLQFFKSLANHPKNKLIMNLLNLTREPITEKEVEADLSKWIISILYDYTAVKSLKLSQFIKTIQNNPNEVLSFIESYVDTLSPLQLKNILDEANSTYSRRLSLLLPTNDGLAEGLNVFEALVRPTNDPWREFVYDILSQMKLNNIQYTKEEANAFMSKLKDALKFGLSLTLPIIGLNTNDLNQSK